jgi:hypothetical protein
MDNQEISLSVLFTFCALFVVASVFCFVWFRQHGENESSRYGAFDAGKWLLICLTILAVVILIGSTLLLLFEYSFYS